jgi:hypothetical protein
VLEQEGAVDKRRQEEGLFRMLGIVDMVGGNAVQVQHAAGRGTAERA